MTDRQLRVLFPFTSHQDLGLRRSVTDTHSQALACLIAHPMTIGPDNLFAARKCALLGVSVHNTSPICLAIWPADSAANAVTDGAQPSTKY